jgi:hypothetical protein
VALATVLTLSGIKLVETPYATWIIPFGFGVGATALVILAWQSRASRRVPLESGAQLSDLDIDSAGDGARLRRAAAAASADR